MAAGAVPLARVAVATGSPMGLAVAVEAVEVTELDWAAVAVEDQAVM